MLPSSLNKHLGSLSGTALLKTLFDVRGNAMGRDQGLRVLFLRRLSRLWSTSGPVSKEPGEDPSSLNVRYYVSRGSPSLSDSKCSWLHLLKYRALDRKWSIRFETNPHTHFQNPTFIHSLRSMFKMDGLLYTLASRDDDNGASRGRRALVVTTVLTALSTIIVAMRLYARLGLMKITGREDWAILISLVCFSESV